jgi:hypothetical protein
VPALRTSRPAISSVLNLSAKNRMTSRSRALGPEPLLVLTRPTRA